jgi:hypothetical protein
VVAENLSPIVAMNCRLIDNDSLAIWRAGDLFSKGNENLAMRGINGLSVTKISDEDREVYGNGLLATAKLPFSQKNISVEVTTIDLKGAARTTLLSTDVEINNKSTLTIIPNPAHYGDDIEIFLNSSKETISWANISIFDAMGNSIVSQKYYNDASENLFRIKLDGVSDLGQLLLSGSYRVIVRYKTISGKENIIKGMFGIMR